MSDHIAHVTRAHVPTDIVPMVGAAGFEPTTPRTPSECATGLRYAPTHRTSMYVYDENAAARTTETD